MRLLFRSAQLLTEELFKGGECMTQQSPIRERYKPYYFNMCEQSRKVIMTMGPGTPKS